MVNKTNNPITRNFKGIWIPKNVYLNKNLNWTEKILLIEIDSLDDGQGCFASNRYFSEFLSVTERTITTAIARLKKFGFIKQIDFNGRKRIMKIRLEENFQFEPKQTSNESGSKLLGSNIYNNKTLNNTINNNKDKSLLENETFSENNKTLFKSLNSLDDIEELIRQNEELQKENIKNVENKELLQEKNYLTSKIQTEAIKSEKEINKQIFGFGVMLLNETNKIENKEARRIIGKWLKTNSRFDVLRFIKEAIERKIIDPLSWINKQLEKQTNEFKQKKQQEIQNKYNEAKYKLEQEYKKTHNGDYNESLLPECLNQNFKTILPKITKWQENGTPIIDDEVIAKLTDEEKEILFGKEGNSLDNSCKEE